MKPTARTKAFTPAPAPGTKARRYFRVCLRSLAALAVALLAAGGLVNGCRSGRKTAPAAHTVRAQPVAMPTPLRAVWVARFHYRYPDDIRTIMRNCARLGLNTVLWQVRGNGTVAYASEIEPWSAEYGHQDPGFDPLQIAVQQAHRHGLRIEAWVNVLPGWRGPRPPPIKSQLWYAHPEWFLYDESGRRQPLAEVNPKTGKRQSFYLILNPCLPEVRRHLTSVIEEIVTKYDVDGVHLDYVRYAWDSTPDARRLYPRDRQTLRLYRQQTGKRPEDDPRAWDHWRANQLTRLVGDVRDMLARRRPGATLSAAVWSDPQRGYRGYLQNAIGWLRAGMVDAVMPMAYTPKLDQFENSIGAYQTLAPAGRIIPGVGIYQHQSADQVGWQLERCRSWGGDFALFSYDALHATAADRGKNGKPNLDPNKQRLRELRRRVVRSYTTAD